MIYSCVWLYSFINDLRKGLKKDGYGILGIAVVLGAILAATVGFIIILKWEAMLIFALFSIPGGLLAGVLSIVWYQRHPEMPRPTTLHVISRFAIVLVSIDALFVLTRIIPPMALIIIAIVIGAISRIVRHVSKKRGH